MERQLDADALAQEIINAWGRNVDAGNAGLLSPEFRALLDKACDYREAKRIADNQRQFNMLSEEDASKERVARQGFLDAYRILDKSRRGK